jgi:hypothetical protein
VLVGWAHMSRAYRASKIVGEMILVWGLFGGVAKQILEVLIYIAVYR